MSALYFTASYSAPQQAVWEALQQAEVWRVLNGVDEIIDVLMNGGDLAAIQWRSKIGPRLIDGKTRVESSTPPAQMTMVVSGGDLLALTTATLSSQDDSTEVEVVGNLEAKGIMAHLVLPVVTESIRHAMPSALKRLNDFL